jgi:glycosyltransferase involved in cell wall biosynthesis
MKILFVIGELKTGGTEKQVIGLANELARQGNEVTIALLGDSAPGNARQVIPEVELKILKLKFFLYPLKALSNVPYFIQFIIKRRYDVVQAFLPESVLVCFPLFFIFSNSSIRIAGVRGTIVMRNIFLQFLYRKTLNFADCVICNSLYLKEYVTRNYKIKETKVITIANGLDLPILPREKVLTRKIGVVSNFHTYKGYKTLLHSIPSVKQPVLFLLMGDGPELISMKKLAKELKVENSIRFLGQVNPNEFLVDCDFAVHPSESEGSSNAILEELSFGLPVIAADIAPNRDLITHGVNGFLAMNKSPSDFASYINVLLDDPNLLNALGNQARKVASSYSWDVGVEKHLDVYKRLQP